MRRLSVFILPLLGACSQPEPFSLAFAPVDGGSRVDCDTPIVGVGPGGSSSVGLADLRFYVSNVRLLDEDGEEVETTFDENGFQYQGTSDRVALIDLTSDSTGSCGAGAISFSEGTARTNDAITGTTLPGKVHAVAFDVGVSQPLMQEVIGANTAESAPSPLNEMYWSWQSGYRHFVFNMAVTDGAESGEGYIHVGSTNCAGADGELALESQDACGFVNTPAVELHDFDLASDVVAVDLRTVLEDLSYVAPVYDPETFEVVGESLGIGCHSFPGQPDCGPIFDRFGIDAATGSSTASANVIFGKL
ncbi:MAG: metallo-mystery pair system four-Cys motif protein [Myxococcota bacterium]